MRCRSRSREAPTASTWPACWAPACAPSPSARTCSRRAATCECSSTRSGSTPPSMPRAHTTPTTSSGAPPGRAGSRAMPATRRLARRSTCAPTPTGPSVTGATRNSRSGRIAPRRHAGWALSTASRRRASTSVPSTSRSRATWPRCAPRTTGRPFASRAWTTRCPRSSVACATTCARTPASGPTSTSPLRFARSSASSWSRRRGRHRPRDPVRPCRMPAPRHVSGWP